MSACYECGVPFAHPETGEVLSTREDFLRAIEEIEEKMQPYWKARRAIREAMSEAFEAPLPAPRYRSERQEKVGRCPRCGGRIESEEAP